MKKNMLFISCLLSVTVLFAHEKKAIYYANGNKHFEYATTNELLNGELTAWYENGNLKIKGQFKNNQKKWHMDCLGCAWYYACSKKI